MAKRGWVRFKVPISTDPGQIQSAVDTDMVRGLTLREMRETLATLFNAKEVLVWRDGFPDWRRAGDISELRAQTAVPSTSATMHFS
jgi:GYF domain 2